MTCEIEKNAESDRRAIRRVMDLLCQRMEMAESDLEDERERGSDPEQVALLERLIPVISQAVEQVENCDSLIEYFEQLQREYAKAVESIDGCGHDRWQVISTCLGTVELICECRDCGHPGVVSDPTDEEWSASFTAPSSPVPWPDASRVRPLIRTESGWG